MTASRTKRRFAPAKINLFLHVGDKRGDGYHDLTSLVVFADAGDWIEVSDAEQTSVDLIGPYAGALRVEPDNLVLKAVRALRDWAVGGGHHTCEVRVTLEKNLPIASGIGGGSTDAAATLLLVAEHWSLPIAVGELEATARSLGADVPVCLHGRSMLVRGMGDVLAPTSDMPPLWFVLVNPGVRIETRRAFAALCARSGAIAPQMPPSFASARALAMFLDRTMNDLAATAKNLEPVVLRAEAALVETEGCLLARVTGSGATCFGIYETRDAAQAAAQKIVARHPSWWVVSAASYVPP